MKGQLTQAQRLGAETVVVARSDGTYEVRRRGEEDRVVHEPRGDLVAWRDVMCGELRADDAGRRVTVAGWADTRRDHGGLVFVDLRDHTGKVQLVINPEHSPAAAETAHEIRNEFVLQATGEVVARAPELVNPDLPTGQIEMQVDELRDPLALDAAPVPARRGERRRDPPPPLPLARHAHRADAAQPAAQPHRDLRRSAA